ncbi:MAG: penicillin acylase family protein, partial [Vulcanimicrobiaceae bacterium]
ARTLAPDARLARERLRGWNGDFDGPSRAAPLAWALRVCAIARLASLHLTPALAAQYVEVAPAQGLTAVLRMVRERPNGWVPSDDVDAFLIGASEEAVALLRARGELAARWAQVGARTARHPLAALAFHAWDGVPFPGLGDAFSPHVQAPVLAQSFRAVWVPGAWQRGGIVIPQGESGEPGSPHYRDGAPLWLSGRLFPLPFGAAAVAEASERLTLAP